MKAIISKSGKRIVLRPPSEKDVEQLLEYINELVEEDVLILMNEKQTLEDEKKYLEGEMKKVESGEAVSLLALEGERLVGGCNVNKGRYRQAHIGMFGISLRKEYRGDGIARQLAEEVIRLAEERLGIKMLELHVYSENDPARGLYERLGFVKYGELPEAVEYKGRLISRIHMFRRL